MLALGCEPKLVVGKWSGGGAGVGGAAGVGGGAGIGGAAGGGGGGEAGTAAGAGPVGCETAGGGAATVGSMTRVPEPVSVPWSTGFENGFCDYSASNNYCYAEPRAGFEIVTAPVHSGTSAAAFNIVVDGAMDGTQTRCVRQGTLPEAGYYSAFFFIPSAPTATNNWNLVHFRGGRTTGALHGLWDVSVNVDAEGALHLYVFDFIRRMTRATAGVPAVPVGSWFQIEVYLKRANDATGEFTVYQDGELALRLTDVSTDDSSFGQWYVGNLANELTPGESTLYVDDVSMREAP
jgi:hypothetical protein